MESTQPISSTAATHTTRPTDAQEEPQPESSYFSRIYAAVCAVFSSQPSAPDPQWRATSTRQIHPDLLLEIRTEIENRLLTNQQADRVAAEAAREQTSAAPPPPPGPAPPGPLSGRRTRRANRARRNHHQHTPLSTLPFITEIAARARQVQKRRRQGNNTQTSCR
ncbi:MAG: hypothetical protein K0U08_01425 [Proteobacteria bacterium]|nr:hypothetical protein [Chlamydiia bacterium]MCH9645297.1 hypothetical protein [Pseudomonadota bacterium]